MTLKNRFSNHLFLLALITGWSTTPVSGDGATEEIVAMGASVAGAFYTVNYIHEGGHYLAGDWLSYDVDMEVHPFSGHAEVEKDRGRVKDHDRGRIAIAGPLVSRGSYELMNMWLQGRPQDWATPYLSWTAVGLRLDLPYQQAKAIVNHWRGDHRDSEDDIAQFYDTLPGGKHEVRLYHALGAALTLWDLMGDTDELMYHISGGLGESQMRRREPRHWNLGMGRNGAFLDWSTQF